MKAMTNALLMAVDRLDTAGLDLKAFKVLLIVSKHEGGGVLELAKKGNISRSVFSRYVTFLSGGTDALPKNEAFISMTAVDHRTKALNLTEKGRELLKTLGDDVAVIG